MTAPSEHASSLVRVSGGNASLVERFEQPLRQALADRRAFFAVHVETVSRGREILVSITSTSGHVPLLFRSGGLDAGFLGRVVRDTVSRLGL
jgi:hypothetical protein